MVKAPGIAPFIGSNSLISVYISQSHVARPLPPRLMLSVSKNVGEEAVWVSETIILYIPKSRINGAISGRTTALYLQH